MKKHEGVVTAANRHLLKRNCIDSEVLKKNKLKLKQTVEQFENSVTWSQKIISLQNCTFTEQEAELQYSKLKAWVESLEESFRIEMEEILFPAFISLYRKLSMTGNSSGAKSFSVRNQSNFFKVPELIKMAERFCSENNNHFTLDISQETYEKLKSFIENNDQPLLQHLLNTTLVINITKPRIESIPPQAESKKNNVDSLNSVEELQDLLAAISRLDELPPTAPFLKMYSIDTGQRKMNAASTSSCQSHISCGFQDSSIAIWDVKNLRNRPKPELSSLDLACAITLYHPTTLPTLSSSNASDSSVSTCRGHMGPVYATQFTPTNTHLLSCSDDTTLRLWDLTTMENSVIYRGHTYPIWSLDISPQGQYFASASQDRTAKLWTFDRTYPLRVLASHTEDVDCVTFHPNGLYVATGSIDKSVRMWSITDGKYVRVFLGHRGTVLAVSFSPCGKLLASAGEDQIVKVWDLASGESIHEYAAHHDVVHGLVWISDSILSSYSADGSIRVWKVTQPNSQASVQPEFASYSVPSPWKVVHLGRGHRNSIVCVSASD